MYRTCFLLLWLLGIATGLTAQKKQRDTVRKYLDSRLALTNKANMDYPAMAFRDGDYWKLVAAYEDTTLLLRVWFRDEELTVKNGPFTLYHRKNVKAVEGHYTDNIREGIWKSWHTNGQLKDSGVFYHNHLTGTWFTWNEKGQLTATHEYATDKAQLAVVRANRVAERRPSLLSGDTSVGILRGVSMTYHPNGNLKDSGSYVDDLKEGLWKEWYANGKQESFGTYKKGLQDGDWEYFRENGHRSTKEQYAGNKVKRLECFDEQGNFSGNTCPLLKPPVALGKFLDFDKYVMDHLFWPEELNRSDIEGNVEIEYIVNAAGVMEELKVTSSPHKAMSDEVLRFFRTLQWSPAMSHNRPISYPMKYVVPFYR
ncbi:TonB family protein [Paraflavitalea sp. CAU 1676]|uniref:TonB family protein n=1 Tax=Paraflavitalea sp. CAU 1676 TaxID=3032598 RepID=UPI0023DB2342|nr:TonB family protein [Paraflavitalea sp. CAU 1676]MDF2189452.1 TonB family protein [Paraflavitalea sp. CAU 1676]